MQLLTDEQIAEGLALARAIPAVVPFDKLSVEGKIRHLALALQEKLVQEQRALVVAAKGIDGLREKLQEAEQALKKNDEDWAAVRELDRQAVVRLEAALQAAEAEKDEARKAYSEERAIATRALNRATDAEVKVLTCEIAARQQARREAFEEAKVLERAVENLLTNAPTEKDMSGYHPTKTATKVLLYLQDIRDARAALDAHRALAEVER